MMNGLNGLHLHTGNRLELLVEQLAVVLAQGDSAEGGAVGSPFAPEQVLVQSLGMSRWLSLQLAERLGICMNCEFPFPKAFLDGLLAEWMPETGRVAQEVLSAERMAWAIYHQLPGLLEAPEFAAVAQFLEDGDSLKRFQLSQRLGNLFDQYLVYRPEMILRWERDEPPQSDAERQMAWQAVLWRAVLWRALNRERHLHFAAALERLRGMEIPPGRRLSVFGISSLPPAQVELLFHLSASRPVHLFLLAPSEEYFGDDLTPRQRARQGVVTETGNPLLTAFGRLHAHFREVLMELDERAGTRLVEEDGLFVAPPEATLLGQLQRDLLSAREPEVPLEPEDPEPTYRVDGSLEIHGCHSPMREVEVLYDQLLARLEADPTLSPRDILVMAPDIESYAPYIHAVFGHPEEEARRIPYSVADRPPRLESGVVDLFLRLLEMVGGRCEVSEMLVMLESGVFSRRFGFAVDDLAQIREWIAASGIRWGVDEQHREALGLPALRATTWRGGLDRLLMGVAARGGNRELAAGILPVDDVEGDGAALLGRLVEAVERVVQTMEELAEARGLVEWPEALERVVERFFADEEQEEELIAVRQIREALGRLGAAAAALVEPGVDGEPEAVPFAVIREWLTEALAGHEQRGRFLAGGVTFCALKPMRSVPARVIWLLGMDEGVFPRKALAMQFDLMAREPRLGDRTVGRDDRYLFLEALISARGQLAISYLARSEKSNEVLPPSIVVSELLDYLHRASGDEDLGEALTTLHPLQAFSRRYFTGPGPLFSYSQANAAALEAGEPEEELPLLERCWPPLEPEEREVRLEQLINCLCGPAAYLLRARQGVFFGRGEETLSDSEPIGINRLERFYLLDEEVGQRVQAGAAEGEPEVVERFVTRAMLPAGEVGRGIYAEVDTEARGLVERVLEERREPEPPAERELRLGDFYLSGRLEKLDAGGLLIYRAGRLRERDRLALWVRHLFHCATAEGAVAPARLIGVNDARVVLAVIPRERALALLERLLGFYEEAMQRVVPFFPVTSLTYAAQVRNPKVRSPMSQTLGAWLGNFVLTGEAAGEPYSLIYPEPEQALDDPFRELAVELLEPMLQAEEEGAE